MIIEMLDEMDEFPDQINPIENLASIASLYQIPSVRNPSNMLIKQKMNSQT